jgi:proteasome lid subunit RPN8/RPN11
MAKNKNQSPSLRFSPTAWAKLVYMRDMTDNEVGGFGITKPNDLLFVTDFILVKQKVTVVSVSFDDSSVADFFENQVEQKRKPEQFARIWLHTHPGDSPNPSMTDEETFDRVFGTCDWSVMFILAQDGSSYARLHFKAGPGGDLKIPVYVDYGCQFDGSDFKSWTEQYKADVTREIFVPTVKELSAKPKEQVDIFGGTEFTQTSGITSEDLLTEIDLMDPMERQALMDELAIRSNFWDEYESEVF